MTTDGTPEEEELPNARAAARAAIEIARALEPAITPTVEDVVHEHGGTLARVATRVKGEDRLTVKIHKRMQFDETAEQAARYIADVLRYTAVLPDEGYWPAGTRLCEALAGAGYDHIEQSTGWQSEGFRGRNERFASPDGFRFELQIHTESSLAAAEETHGWYEEERESVTTLERRWELQQMRDNRFAQVPIPPGTPLR